MITWDHVWPPWRESVTPQPPTKAFDSNGFKLIGALAEPTDEGR
jgi:hypothetical protein